MYSGSKRDTKLSRAPARLPGILLIGLACLLTVGCGNKTTIIQQPAPATPTTTGTTPITTTVLTPTTPVTPTTPTTVTTTIAVPSPTTTTIVITVPGPLATPVPTTTPTTTSLFPIPPFNPNAPPWWARNRGRGTVTIIRIKPGEIEIITRRRGGWDGWRRGPNGWFNPETGQWIPPNTAGVPATIPVTAEAIPFDTNTTTQTIVVPK